jgi:hypothetical protein
MTLQHRNPTGPDGNAIPFIYYANPTDAKLYLYLPTTSDRWSQASTLDCRGARHFGFDPLYQAAARCRIRAPS